MTTYRDYIASPPITPGIVAHRGAWRSAPENSIAAIEAAIAAGYEIVEIDIQRSADGGLFLMHDDTLERMTGRAETAGDLPLAELRRLALKAGDGGAGAALSDQRIPTMAEALETARGRIFVDLDTKFPEQLPLVAAEAGRLGMGDQAAVKAYAHTAEEAAELAEAGAAHGVTTMPAARFNPGNIDPLIEIFQAINAPAVQAKFDALSTIADRRDAFRRAGVALWVNTLNPVACCGYDDDAALKDPDAIWGALVEAGVSLVQTDEPEALARFRAGPRGEGEGEGAA